MTEVSRAHNRELRDQLTGLPVEQVPAWISRSLRRLLQRRLSDMVWGCVLVRDTDGEMCFGVVDNPGPTVTLVVHDRDFYFYAGFGGSVGVGQSYSLGLWDVSNLTDLVRIFVRNRDRLHNLDGAFSRLGQSLYRWVHARRQNSSRNSRRNISAHYDLGNDFFGLMLDPSMMYSCAVFDETDDLHAAQRRKLELICRKLDLRSSDHVLEIGTGWGGFAEYVASRYGCRVTTTTISRAQHDYAVERVRSAGLSDRVTVLCDDYRDLSGEYDKIVSIEMIEAVGHQYFDHYFDLINRLLRPEGLALIQAIVIEEQSYERARDSVDFIKRFIFPGGCLPSYSAIAEAIRGTADLRISHLEDIGLHYVRTLQQWRERMESCADQLRELGYEQAFLRLWKYYLSYCEGGFAERSIATAQLLLSRPHSSIHHIHGLTV